MLNEYVTKILHLVCEIIGAESATLFFDIERSNSQINCVGSTDSIMDWQSKKVLTEKEIRKAGYKRGDGETGQVFQTGKLAVVHAKEDATRNPRFVEVRGEKTFLGRTTAFVPLRLIYGNSQSNTYKTVGVLRCTGKSLGKPGVFQTDTFDQIDLETLQFVCDQIAPVIQTLTARIERERAISIVKHDLVSPISHIRHIADKLETIQQVSIVEPIESLKSSNRKTYQMKIPFRDLMNIKTFAIEASNLVFQLDPDFSQLTRLTQEETLLEGHIIARLKRAMQYQAWEEKQMSIDFAGFDKIPALNVDRGMIERVFYNLISNAIKYGQVRSEIVIRAFESGESYCVTVSNKGRGVSEKDRDLIFDEEYRSSVAIESAVPGLGLGLYIARKAMEKHGGKLTITQLANPTTFCAYFPTSLRAT
jgi:signal transduction histidine kinase